MMIEITDFMKPIWNLLKKKKMCCLAGGLDNIGIMIWIRQSGKL